MSLLMKALEKAAKDRGEARQETAAPAVSAPVSASAPAPAASRSELSLEPIAVEAASPAVSPRIDPAPRPAAAPSRAAAASAAASPASPTTRDPAQAQAGAVLQAQSGRRPATGGVGAYLRLHPIVVLGSLAGVVAIAFGIYVYLQIFHPTMFLAQPAASKGSPQPIAQAPGAVPQPPVPLPSGLLLKEAAAEAEAAAAASSAAEAPRAKPQPTPAAAEEAPRNTISVSTVSAEPTLNPQLAQAYAALQAGRTDEAQRLYSQLAGAEPKNVDALLGLAALAAQQGQVEEAVRRYLQILDLEPRHALAQSGLIALLGRADPAAAESKLRQLIAREPSAYLYFTLGNLYADQSQWAGAQQSYFQAHHLEPVNPDYAYNLAVALEHVNQPKLALGFYRRAVALATARGRSNFSLPQAQNRVGLLAQQVE